MKNPSVLFLIALITLPSTIAFAVKGIQAGVDPKSGFRPFRLNIATFQYSGAPWDLYILAMKEFMQMNQSDPMSYFQISGIHGQPRAPWDGVVGNGSEAGYCTHSSILFPMWHRPYLLLYESQLWKIAQKIASQYPVGDRPRYQASAQSFRIPFWDWSTNSTMPDVVNQPSIKINTPGGQLQISNPLYTYTFHPLNLAQFDGYLTQYKTTVRTPNSSTKQSQPEVANAYLNRSSSYLHDQTYLLFSAQNDFQIFSNAGNGNEMTNIEAMHGTIHNMVGGATADTWGHMTLVPHSAFDPVFWLHHANVDRLTAIWQAIWPDSFVVPQRSSGTYMVESNSIENESSPLYPFHSDDGTTFHTSDSVRSLKLLGYTYPELWDWAHPNKTDLSASVRRLVNQIYHPSHSNLLGRATNVKANVGYGITLAANWEWSLVISVDRDRLSTDSVLCFFSGSPPSAPDGYLASPSLLGSISLAPPGIPIFSELSSIPLTASLLSLSSLSPDVVVPHLKSVLEWRATKSFRLDGIVSFTINARTVKQADSVDDFPSYGKWVAFANGLLSERSWKVIE